MHWVPEFEGIGLGTFLKRICYLRRCGNPGIRIKLCKIRSTALEVRVGVPGGELTAAAVLASGAAADG